MEALKKMHNFKPLSNTYNSERNLVKEAQNKIRHDKVSYNMFKEIIKAASKNGTAQDALNGACISVVDDDEAWCLFEGDKMDNFICNLSKDKGCNKVYKLKENEKDMFWIILQGSNLEDMIRYTEEIEDFIEDHNIENVDYLIFNRHRLDGLDEQLRVKSVSVEEYIDGIKRRAYKS